jgi:hypothetical protein
MSGISRALIENGLKLFPIFRKGTTHFCNQSAQNHNFRLSARVNASPSLILPW